MRLRFGSATARQPYQFGTTGTRPTRTRRGSAYRREMVGMPRRRRPTFAAQPPLSNNTSTSKKSSSARETALLSDQEVYGPEARLRLRPTQPRHRAVPRKHIEDGPKGAASRVRARQRSALQLERWGRLFYGTGCWVVRRQKALVPPGLVTFTVFAPVVAVSAVPLT